MVGASQEDVAKLTIHVVKGQDLREGFAAAQRVWGNFPTAITVSIVESLARPRAQSSASTSSRSLRSSHSSARRSNSSVRPG